jgi:general secretion pathway protein K
MQAKIKQRGSVIIVTLWTITLVTILVTVLAGQIRLSARAAFFHQEDLRNWSGVLAAINQAEMELMLEKMPRPPENLEDLDEVGRNPLYRFDGEEQQLAYPQAEGISVRIYDHAGKINLREISRPRLRALLEKKLGEDADVQVIDAMMAAWGDWLDLNDQPGINGAEKEYYGELEPPYAPRNGALETVDEILLIRGFAEVFADVDLDAAFTLYGENELVNLNLATVEAMRLLPGLDDELIEQILLWRQENEFQGNGDVAQIVPIENMAELRPWLNSRKVTNFYTIMAYRKSTPAADAEADDPENPLPDDLSTNAYAETVEVNSFTDMPRVLKTNPYQRIPTRVQIESDDEEGQ